MTESIRPLWTLGKAIDNDERMLEWQNNAYSVELKRHAKYRDQAMKHIALYKGKHYADNSSARAGYAESSSQGLAYRTPRVSKLVVNYIYQGTQQRVSLITRNRPAVTIDPLNTEYSDRVSAKLVKYWVDYELQQTQFDRLVQEAVNGTYVCGESYLHPYWDPNRGPKMPAWLAAEKEAKESDQEPSMPVVDAKGNPVMGEDGEPLVIQRPIRAGDIAVKSLTPLTCLVQSNVSFTDADYFFEELWRDVDTVRAEYPEFAEKVTTEQSSSLSEGSSSPDMDPNKVLVRKFWHRSTDQLGRGRFVVSTRTAILENEPLPEGMTSLPLIRLTDIDVPGQQRGLSLISQAKGLNATLNDFASMIRRNTILAAHPKWLIPKGSIVKREAIGNDISEIDYKGPIEPRMVPPPPLSQEVTALRREFRDEIFSVFRSSDAMQGKIPPNIRSAMAMQLVDEQDEQRANTDVGKYQAMIRRTVEVMLEIAGCYYTKGDPRLIPIVGRDQRYLLQEFDPSHLTKGYDVKIGNSSGLPATKAAKTEVLIELRKAFGPGVVRDEQVADMLEFGDTDRYYDQAAVASRAAEAENEAILSGQPIEDPAAFENTLVHWTIHMRDIQNRGFKTSTPEDVQLVMVQHIQATEMLMLESARKNPAFALELVKLPLFPVFFALDTVDRVVLDRARLQQPLSLEEVQALENGAPPSMPSPAPTGASPPMPPMPPPAGAIPGSAVAPPADPSAVGPPQA